MLYKKIISDAWHFTQENKRLVKWFGLVPAMLQIVVGITYIAYQYLALSASGVIKSFGGSDHLMMDIFGRYVTIFQNHPTIGLSIIVGIIVVVVLFLFVPVICEGALIQLIARSKHGERPSVSRGISHGLLNFLPLFRYHIVSGSFAITSILGEVAFILRTLGWGWFRVLIVPVILMCCISLVLTLLFTYSEYFIVIDKKKVFSSMKLSSILVIHNWKHTMLILILMSIIGIRILINILIVVLVPAVIIGITAIFVYSAALFKIGTIVGGIVGLVLFYFASYLNAVLDIWAKTVWVYSFLELTALEEIDARGNVITGGQEVSREDGALS